MLSSAERQAISPSSNKASSSQSNAVNRRRWGSSFALATIGFLLVNALIFMAGLTQPKKLSLSSLGDVAAAYRTGRPASWWLAHAYLSRPSAPDIVLLGSSQLGGLHAADADILNKPVDYVLYHGCRCLEQSLASHNLKASCFTAGMVGSMISDHYVITNALFTANNQPKVAVITLSPRDFVDSALPSVSATEPFRFFAPYIDVSPIQSEAFSNVVERVSWFANKYVPLRNIFAFSQEQTDDVNPVRSTISAQASKKRNKQDPLLVMNATSMYCLRPGDCTVYPHIPAMFVDNSLDYTGRYSRIASPMFKTQMRFLQKMLAGLKGRHIKAVVIGMPLDSTNRAILPASFWNNYKGELGGLCQANGASFEDFSDNPNFRRADFVDGVHMAASGGLKLAGKIADVIARTPDAFNAEQH